MQFRITTRGEIGKYHVMRYAEVPDALGYYIFWCGVRAHKDVVETRTDAEITCGLCAKRVAHRAQRQLLLRSGKR